MKGKRIFAVLLTLILLVSGAFSGIGRADFGDFAGDNDYGDWGGGDDWGGDNDWDWDNDDDDGGWVYYGGSTGSSSSGPAGGIFTLVVFAVIVFVVIYSIKKKGPTGTKRQQVRHAPGGQATPGSMLQPLANYRILDPGFSEAAMREKIANLYVQFQNAWHNKDISPLRPYLSDAFYAQSEAQLQHYIRDRQTSYLERIAVLGVNLSGFLQENGKDVLVARVSARFTNYVLSDDTGELVRGSRTAEKFMEYEWRLERSSGRVTGVTPGVTVQNCPNCGAPVNVNRAAKCEYCGSVLTVDSFDWVVSGITGLSQRTVGS